VYTSGAAGSTPANAAVAASVPIGASSTVPARASTRAMVAPSTRNCRSSPKNGVANPPRAHRSPIFPLVRYRAFASTRSPIVCHASSVVAYAPGSVIARNRGHAASPGGAHHSATAGSSRQMSLQVRSPSVTGDSTGRVLAPRAVGSSLNGSTGTAGGDGSRTLTS
jgi:hypothetical protein